jgi:hypothetical protein
MAGLYLRFCCCVLGFAWKSAPWWIHEALQWILIGKPSPVVTGQIEGHACEVEYYGRFGLQVGFWAYGSFDPQYPYQG